MQEVNALIENIINNPALGLESGDSRIGGQESDLFNIVPCIITIQDRNYRILRHNNEFAAKFGYRVGDYCFSAYKDRREKCEDCPLAKTFADGLPHYSEESGYNKDGTPTYWVVRTAPIKNSDGEVIAAMEMSIDITARIEAEQKLVQASKLATLGRMASGIAHELNQPLSVIKTASNFLSRKVRSRETLREDTCLTLLSKMDANVDRASKIINHLRAFSRQSDTAGQSVQVNDVLRQALDAFAQQLKIRGIGVSLDIDESVPPVKADPNRLEQVFINLLVNARDAIEEKWGEGPCRDGRKKICFTTAYSNGKVVITVSDTGIGIHGQNADKIFEPFFTTKGVGKGTGLGLSISYGIIKDSGGSIQLAGGSEEGATFVVELPAAGEATSA